MTDLGLSLNFFSIVLFQEFLFFLIPLFPIFFMFLVLLFVEKTNLWFHRNFSLFWSLLIFTLINTSSVRSSLYRPLYKKFFWFLVADFVLLSYLGQAPAESPYIEVGQLATVYYFGFFIVLIPILGRLEKNLASSSSI